MSARSRLQSNPFSTGGGGPSFETCVQTAFGVLMLTGGVAPCLPPWPIKRIKLQGRYAGFDTDDLIVFAGEPNGEREARLLAQIKHSIKITSRDKTFGEVVQAAWNDFRNPSVFTPGRDAIAIITGPLSAAEINDTRTILEWARHCEDASEFVTKVDKANFSSTQKRAKLKAFRVHLKNANEGAEVSDDDLWRFMKSFHLLGYDLDIKAGVTLSLIHSLMSQCSEDDPHALWSKIVVEIQSANKNAGTLTVETVSVDLCDAFKRRPKQTIPEILLQKEETAVTVGPASTEHPTELAVACLLGSWCESESSNADRLVVEALSGSAYSEWIIKIRDVLLQPATPLKLTDGKWTVTRRREIWDALGPRLFDDHLDRFRKAAVDVLRERDPKFELSPDERYMANLHGKVLTHSRSLRNGLAESLALLGSHPKALTSCSLGKPDSIAVLAVREVLAGADWILWGSLNDLLPLLAEAAPREFLDAVETSLNGSPCPFDTLFAQEGMGIFGGNYLTGLLWALETLAWDAEVLARVVVVLGGLAARDPGGNWGNRPANSLSTILLPWLPQTRAPVPKRKTAVQTLAHEFPDVAWKVVLSLLPTSHQMSSGSRKPAWREMIPDDWPRRITGPEYWQQITIYTELATNMAKSDLVKLADLIDHLDDLPETARAEVLAHLKSGKVTSLPEERRLPLWTKLVALVSKHRKFTDAKWAMSPEEVTKVATVAEQLAPHAPGLRHRRLFTDQNHSLYEEKGNYEEQRERLEQRRQNAVTEVFASGGVQAILDFARAVESPMRVGIAFGTVADKDVDGAIFPELLETQHKALSQFSGGFVWGRFGSQGWRWADEFDISHWTPSQMGQFLAYLPFEPETWKRVTRLFGQDESPYWTKADVSPYGVKSGLELAIDRLVQHGRPYAAIRCLGEMCREKQYLDGKQAVRALLAALDSPETPYAMDADDVREVIKSLQDDPQTNPDDLFQVEWAYLPLFEHDEGSAPKLLEQRLADDPAFFCEAIRIVYRSKNEIPPYAEVSEQQKNLAENTSRLLSNWRTPPGSRKDGTFDGNAMSAWLDEVKRACTESGHLEVAFITLGHVLVHTPPDPDGFWIHRAVAEAVNAPEANDIRDGFTTELYNLRGMHGFTAGREERELADKYRKQAEEVESHGYHRLANSLRDLATGYDREAEREESRDPYDR